MALTPEEQAELASLKAQGAPKGGLTPEEQAELASLKAQDGGKKPWAQMSMEDRVKQQMADTPALIPSIGAPAAGSKLASFLSSPATVAGMGAVGGASEPADSWQDRAGNAAKGGLKSLLLSGPGIIADAANSAANSSMKRAVGLTGQASKTAPAGVGNRLVDEGIWGTKAGMADQVAGKYKQVEDEIQNLAETLPGRRSADSIARPIDESAQQHINKETGLPLSGGESAYSTKTGIANNVRTGGAGYEPGTPDKVVTTSNGLFDERGAPMTRTDVTPGTPAAGGTYGAKALLGLKRAGDSEAFNQSGLVGNTHAADAYKTQADAARAALADMSDGAMPAALKREQTFISANKGLMKPDMTAKNPVSLTDIGAGIVGGGSHGLPGAGTAVLASKAVALPLVQSLFAKGAQQLVGNPLSAADSVLTNPAVTIPQLAAKKRLFDSKK